MEQTRLSYIKNNIYIPPQEKLVTPRLPSHHPSLIIPDRTGDINKSATCGCCKGDHCIRESATWLYGPNGEVHPAKNDINGSQDALYRGLVTESKGRQL